jgi:hypothetical protein
LFTLPLSDNSRQNLNTVPVPPPLSRQRIPDTTIYHRGFHVSLDDSNCSCHSVPLCSSGIDKDQDFGYQSPEVYTQAHFLADYGIIQCFYRCGYSFVADSEGMELEYVVIAEASSHFSSIEWEPVSILSFYDCEMGLISYSVCIFSVLRVYYVSLYLKIGNITCEFLYPSTCLLQYSRALSNITQFLAPAPT